MLTNRSLGAMVLVFVMAIGVTIAPPASAQNLNTVYQGLGFRTVRSHKACTIGYNDVQNRRSYTAAHCGENGEKVQLLSPKLGRSSNLIVGTFYKSSAYNDRGTANDWGWIEWNSLVDIKGNNFSGDDIIRPEAIQPGEKICYHGYTTHGSSLQSHCATVATTIGNNIYATGGVGQQGDSGGPVFIPGRGFVGVHSGYDSTQAWGTGYGERMRVELLRAAFPEDGPEVSLFNWGLQYMSNPNNPGVYSSRLPVQIGRGEPGPEASPFEMQGVKDDGSGEGTTKGTSGGSSEGSSDMSPGAVFGIVLSIILALIPLALGAIRF